MEAMWRILQQAEPDDYVIATGRAVSVRVRLVVVQGGRHRHFVEGREEEEEGGWMGAERHRHGPRADGAHRPEVL